MKIWGEDIEISECEFCPDGHENPARRPWAVWVGPERDIIDGQPTVLHVAKTGGQHVAESDAQWVRDSLGAVERVRAIVDRIAADPANVTDELWVYSIRKALAGDE